MSGAWTDKTPCPKNPNGRDYHRWYSEREPVPKAELGLSALKVNDVLIRSSVRCQFCGAVEELGVCPPHTPSVAYGCPGWVRMTVCAVCSTQLEGDEA